MLIILIILIWCSISVIINSDIIIYMLNLKYIIPILDNSKTKGTLVVNNVKINNIDLAVEKVKDGALFIGAMTAAAKVMKNSFLPVGAKLGFLIGIGAACLVSYKMVQKNLRHKSEGDLNINADNIKNIISAYKSNNNSDTSIPTGMEGSGSYMGGNKDNYIISSIDIEQLQLDFYLHIFTLYLYI